MVEADLRLNRFEDCCVCCQACQLRFYCHIQSMLSIFLLLRNTHTLKISPAWRLLCSSCWLWACEFPVSASGVLGLQVWVTMPWNYKYMNIYTHMCISILSSIYVCVHVCIYAYMYACMCVCIVCIYISIYHYLSIWWTRLLMTLDIDKHKMKGRSGNVKPSITFYV